MASAFCGTVLLKIVRKAAHASQWPHTRGVRDREQGAHDALDRLSGVAERFTEPVWLRLDALALAEVAGRGVFQKGIGQRGPDAEPTGIDRGSDHGLAIRMRARSQCSLP